MLVSRETSEISAGTRMFDLLKRPQITYDCLRDFDVNRPKIDDEIFEQIEVEIKYDGYINKQMSQIEAMKRLESKKLPTDVDYSQVDGLRLEAVEKLNLVKPENIGQASRISGVSPADISVLLIWIRQKSRRSGQ